MKGDMIMPVKTNKNKITYHELALKEISEPEAGNEEDKIFYKVVRENWYNGGFLKKEYPFKIYKDYNYGILFKTSYEIAGEKIQDKIKQYLKKNKDKITASHRAYPGKKLSRNNNFFSKSYIEYLNKKYALDLKVNKNVKYNDIEWSDHRLYIKYNEEELEEIENGYKKEDEIISLIIDDYYEKAKRYINKKIEKYSQIMNIEPNRIIVKKNMRSKPSDCSEKGNITFAWNVLRFPEELIETLIIHELAHLAKGEFNGHDDKYYEITSMYIDEQFQKYNLIEKMSQNMFFFNEDYFIQTLK